MKKEIERVTIRSNGNQASYGIGEIIDVIPARYIHKIEWVVKCYYNQPIMEIDGQRVDFKLWGDKYGCSTDVNPDTVIGFKKR